ncbi:TPA: PAAR domain-containing protein [Salmonella enterica]|nr:PAAR domain-containing protein [Salmonella enterica]MCH5735977.1 PAAR domain-containing protein [Salmonella enterica]MCH5741756.1 PAAR domain-containing protein [Salmonella enterica]MCH5745700.1 PAAR domain-containing protein [Salmonella enterica]MCH5755328.1 PAAR domain-containing protein [Salmonella enterica]
MATGYYLVQGDKTSCGGKITGGTADHQLPGNAAACEGDPVTCGKHAGTYKITGGIPGDIVHDRHMAGTLHSTSTCPCKAHFIPSVTTDTYE